MLVVFSVRVVSEATLEIVARLFYAQHNTRTPMFAYLGWLVVNVAIAYAFVDELGIVALALASTVAFTLLSTVLFLLNRRALDGLHERELGLSLLRAVVATTGMAAVILGLGQIIDNALLFLLVGAVAGAAAYLVLQLLLGSRELPDLLQLILRREPLVGEG